jgi:hypothetical protein
MPSVHAEKSHMHIQNAIASIRIHTLASVFFFSTYKAARPPINPMAPRTNGATVFCAAHALLLLDDAVPLAEVVPVVPLGGVLVM